MLEEERKAIVEDGCVYLENGLKAKLAGWINPDYCSVHSARAGFWACHWETARDVLSRPNRRFTSWEVWKTGNAWLGLTPGPDDFQTQEDYDRYLALEGGGGYE